MRLIKIFNKNIFKKSLQYVSDQESKESSIFELVRAAVREAIFCSSESINISSPLFSLSISVLLVNSIVDILERFVVIALFFAAIIE